MIFRPSGHFETDPASQRCRDGFSVVVSSDSILLRSPENHEIFEHPAGWSVVQSLDNPCALKVTTEGFPSVELHFLSTLTTTAFLQAAKLAGASVTSRGPGSGLLSLSAQHKSTKRAPFDQSKDSASGHSAEDILAAGLNAGATARKGNEKATPDHKLRKILAILQHHQGQEVGRASPPLLGSVEEQPIIGPRDDSQGDRASDESDFSGSESDASDESDPASDKSDPASDESGPAVPNAPLFPLRVRAPTRSPSLRMASPRRSIMVPSTGTSGGIRDAQVAHSPLGGRLRGTTAKRVPNAVVAVDNDLHSSREVTHLEGIQLDELHGASDSDEVDVLAAAHIVMGGSSAGSPFGGVANGGAGASAAASGQMTEYPEQAATGARESLSSLEEAVGGEDTNPFAPPYPRSGAVKAAERPGLLARADSASTLTSRRPQRHSGGTSNVYPVVAPPQTPDEATGLQLQPSLEGHAPEIPIAIAEAPDFSDSGSDGIPAAPAQELQSRQLPATPNRLVVASPGGPWTRAGARCMPSSSIGVTVVSPMGRRAVGTSEAIASANLPRPESGAGTSAAPASRLQLSAVSSPKPRFAWLSALDDALAASDKASRSMAMRARGTKSSSTPRARELGAAADHATAERDGMLRFLQHEQDVVEPMRVLCGAVAQQAIYEACIRYGQAVGAARQRRDITKDSASQQKQWERSETRLTERKDEELGLSPQLQEVDHRRERGHAISPSTAPLHPGQQRHLVMHSSMEGKTTGSTSLTSASPIRGTPVLAGSPFRRGLRLDEETWTSMASLAPASPTISHQEGTHEEERPALLTEAVSKFSRCRIDSTTASVGVNLPRGQSQPMVGQQRIGHSGGGQRLDQTQASTLEASAGGMKTGRSAAFDEIAADTAQHVSLEGTLHGVGAKSFQYTSDPPSELASSKRGTSASRRVEHQRSADQTVREKQSSKRWTEQSGDNRPQAGAIRIVLAPGKKPEIHGNVARSRGYRKLADSALRAWHEKVAARHRQEVGRLRRAGRSRDGARFGRPTGGQAASNGVAVSIVDAEDQRTVGAPPRVQSGAPLRVVDIDVPWSRPEYGYGDVDPAPVPQGRTHVASMEQLRRSQAAATATTSLTGSRSSTGGAWAGRHSDLQGDAASQQVVVAHAGRGLVLEDLGASSSRKKFATRRVGTPGQPLSFATGGNRGLAALRQAGDRAAAAVASLRFS